MGWLKRLICRHKWCYKVELDGMVERGNIYSCKCLLCDKESFTTGEIILNRPNNTLTERTRINDKSLPINLSFKSFNDDDFLI